MIEIHKARVPFVADGVTYPAGSFVVLMHQPYARYAKTMLERQVYTESGVRLYPGGPPREPLDLTAHSLPFMTGATCVQVDDPFEAELDPVPRVAAPIAVPKGAIRSTQAEHGYTLCPNLNYTAKAVNRLLALGYHVYRTMTPAGPKGKESPGAFYVAPGDGLEDALEDYAEHYGIRVSPADPSQVRGAPALKLREPRLGLYRSYAATADEGWTRFVFDEYGFPYKTLWDADVKAGGLASQYDTIILPAQRPSQVSDGMKEGDADAQYVGGLGERGRAAIHDFTSAGGTLIALGWACNWAIAALGMRVKDVLWDKKRDEIIVPGVMLRAILDTSHPIAYGMPHESTVIFAESPAFEVCEGRVVGRYPSEGVLQSGWILGNEKLIHDRACIVEAPYGKGKVILLGARVQFRGESRGTYKILFNSVYLGSSSETRLP
jgi:hypothetical protein